MIRTAAVSLLFASLVFGQTVAKGTQGDVTEWIAQVKRTRLIGPLTEGERLELALTTVTGDDGRGFVTTFAVTSAGKLCMRRVTPFAIQGGGNQLSPADLKRLQSMARTLPDAPLRMLPVGRRLLIETPASSGSGDRVYDRADLPDSVWEIIRLVGADAWPIFDFPEVQPAARWKKGHPVNGLSEPREIAENIVDERTLAVSSDGRKIVIEHPGVIGGPNVHIENEPHKREPPFDPAAYTTLSIRDSRSGAVINEMREPSAGRRYVSAYSAWFTPDNRHLLVLTSLPEMQTYDTFTWRRVNQLRGLPQEAVAYFPSVDWHWGVAVFSSGEISLWDKRVERRIASIDSGAELKNVSFSPDNSRVAVVTQDRETATSHLRIWDFATGQLVSELRPFERRRTTSSPGQPIWRHDGQYVLASSPNFNGATPTLVAVWDAKAGRYRGALAGCQTGNDLGAQIVLDGSKLFTTCGSDEVVMWNIDSATHEIETFYKSLGIDSK